MYGPGTKAKSSFTCVAHCTVLALWQQWIMYLKPLNNPNVQECDATGLNSTA
jgi:hypothetical protein